MRGSWLCVDANLVIRLIADPNDEAVLQLWERWDAEGRQLAAPALLYYEVTNALYRYRRMGLMGPSSVRLALQAALSLPLHLHQDVGLHRRALDLAERFDLPAAYDGHYLALAERLGAEFWTADRRLVEAVQAALPWVHLVERDGR
jgi:predicted nucleic acid-binding protein